MARKKSWSDLTRPQQVAVVIGGVAELGITAAALTDLTRRPPAHIRGPKAVWALGFVVQPFGPLAYLALGRR
jgi:Phospholipase_D-nuclease N-terminal